MGLEDGGRGRNFTNPNWARVQKNSKKINFYENKKYEYLVIFHY